MRTFVYDCRIGVRDTTQIWQDLHRQMDLEGLIRWATRKRLAGPRRHYKHLLIDAEDRLFYFRLHRPVLVHFLKLVYWLTLSLNPTSSYRKGSAANYGTRQT